MSREAGRKAVHIGSASFALLLPWLTWWQAAGLALLALAFNALLLPRIGGRGIWREADHARGYALGILLYPLSVLGFLLLFPTRLHLAALLWGLLAFGDGFASMTGKKWGARAPLPWNPDKSWIGSLTYMTAGGLGGAALALWVEPGLGAGRLLWYVLPVAALGALVESWDTGVDDNLSVSVLTAPALLALASGEPRLLAEGLLQPVPWVAAILCNGLLALSAWRARAVDRSGMLGGLLLGVAVWVLGGWRAWLLLVLFFLVGSLLTRVGRDRKEAVGAAQEKGGRRSARHAWANGGAAAWLALAAAASPRPAPLLVGLAAAFATAAFDTASSEGGMVWGRRTFLPTTLRPVPPGTEGAISLEGTLVGAAAGGLVAAAGWAVGLYGLGGVPAVAAGALVGGVAESFLGALAGPGVDNEFLNLTNTVLGAAAAVCFYLAVC